MHLLSAPLAGFAACPNGWIELYIRGSSTRATWYSSFEGDGANSTGANITLDAYGSAEVYVNQLVDVVVKQSDGVLYRQYTDGYASPNTEVVSQSFTGTDYNTAVSAASEPTTLQAVLDLWKTNAGAIDWKVLIGGSATTLQNAFGFGTGLVYNVKSPAYGAVGDGLTNDQSAIQAALAAAVAAGGGIVFFPMGTYLVTTAIEWDHRVSILGIGARQSVITTNSAANGRIITLTAGTAQKDPIWIAGMSFASTQSNTGEQLYASVAVNWVIERCGFGASATATGYGVSVTGASRLRIRDCRFTLNSGTVGACSLSTTCDVSFEDNIVETGGTAFAGALLDANGETTITGCTFDMSTVTGVSTIYAIRNNNSTDVTRVYGNRFVMLAQAFTACLRMTAASLVSARGNDFSFATQYSVASNAVLAAGSRLELSPYVEVSSSATPTVPDGYEFAYMNSTTTVPLWTVPRIFFYGQTVTIAMKNSSGAGWAAISFATPGWMTTLGTTGVAFPTVASTEYGLIEFIAENISGPTWVARFSAN